MGNKLPKQTIQKTLIWLVKILRWPVLYYGVLIGGFYGLSWIFSLVMGEGTQLHQATDRYFGEILIILVIAMLVLSYVTSTFFTETFLVSTGLATAMYLIGSLFLKAPQGSWTDENFEFDALKMYAVLALVAIVLLGDLIAFIVRKILNKRNVRNMMKHS